MNHTIALATAVAAVAMFYGPVLASRTRVLAQIKRSAVRVRFERSSTQMPAYLTCFAILERQDSTDYIRDRKV